MDNPKGSVDLSISDLLDHISIVPLETNDDLLLSTSGTRFIVTDRHILVAARDKLIQFSHQGKYIRTLAFRGNGPHEFRTMGGILVDEKREILYYAPGLGNPQPISSIDLKSGSFLEPHTPDLPRYTINAIDSEGMIYGSHDDRSLSSDAVLAYKYNPQNKTTTIYRGCHGFDIERYSHQIFMCGNRLFFRSAHYSDTLFSLEHDKITPQYVCTLKNPVPVDFYSTNGGIFLKFPISNTSFDLIEKSKLNVQTRSDGMGYDVYSTPLAFLVVNKKGEQQSIRSIHIDPIALTIDTDDYIKNSFRYYNRINPIPIVSGSWAYLAVESYNMTDMIDTALNENQLSTSQRKMLQEVALQIDKESNPVLIIGKIK